MGEVSVHCRQMVSVQDKIKKNIATLNAVC